MSKLLTFKILDISFIKHSMLYQKLNVFIIFVWIRNQMNPVIRQWRTSRIISRWNMKTIVVHDLSVLNIRFFHIFSDSNCTSDVALHVDTWHYFIKYFLIDIRILKIFDREFCFSNDFLIFNKFHFNELMNFQKRL